MLNFFSKFLFFYVRQSCFFISFYFFEDIYIYILQTGKIDKVNFNKYGRIKFIDKDNFNKYGGIKFIDKVNFNKYGGIKYGALGAFFRIIFVKVKRLESHIHGSKKIKASIIIMMMNKTSASAAT